MGVELYRLFIEIMIPVEYDYPYSNDEIYLSCYADRIDEISEFRMHASLLELSKVQNR